MFTSRSFSVGVYVLKTWVSYRFSFCVVGFDAKKIKHTNSFKGKIEKKDEKLRFGFSCSFFLCTYPYVSGFGFFSFNFFSFAQKSVKGHVKTSLSKIYQINSKYFDHKFITPVCVRLYSLLFNFITSHTLSRTQKE